MRFTRRRPDRSASGLLVAVALLGAADAGASCSSSDDGTPPSSSPSDGAASDAARETAADPLDVRDAGWTDASPLPVVCNAPPCATALVTTLGANADDLDEGFCALLADGAVACWGANGAGQLGRGEEAGSFDSATPRRVVGLTEVVMLDHTCAVDKSGAVWCWGTGPFVRGGAAATSTERAPRKLDVPAATKVAMGHSTACAEGADGVVCWGSNADGQLGPLSTLDSGAPLPITLGPGAAIRAIAVGRATFVLREDGALVTWGANPPIGRVSPIFPDPYPQRIAIDGISTADLAHDNACATAGGTGYCWGASVVTHGSGTTDRALPEPVVAPEPIVQIATTRTHRIENVGVQRYRWCAAGLSGALYCWGLNESGQAGDGTQGYAFDAVKVGNLPDRVAQVRTTPNTTCALLTSGKIYCWGSNYNGQLGNGQSRGRSFVPVEVVLP